MILVVMTYRVTRKMLKRDRETSLSQDRRAAKRPKFSNEDPSTWNVSDMWWV